MKKFFIVAALFLTVAGTASAQNPKWGLDFSLSDLLSNIFYPGGTSGGAGFRYALSSDMWLRLGASLHTSSRSRDSTVGVMTDSSTMSFGVSPAILFGIARAKDVHAYVGGQIDFNSSSTTIETSSSTSKMSSSGFGIGAVLGAGWTPWPNVDLSAEFRLGFMSSGSSSESGGKTTSMPSTSHIDLAPSGGFTMTFLFP